MPKKRISSKTPWTVRIDSDVSRQANEIIETLGITKTTAISMFLRAIIRENGLPFRVATIQGTEFPEELLEQSENAKK